jgi:2-isopropylmalate synthase
LKELGTELQSEEALNAAFARFKELADKKSEIFDEDLQMLVSDEAISHDLEHFKLLSMMAHSETGETPVAKVVLAEDGAERHAEAQGSGRWTPPSKPSRPSSAAARGLTLYSVVR